MHWQSHLGWGRANKMHQRLHVDCLHLACTYAHYLPSVLAHRRTDSMASAPQPCMQAHALWAGVPCQSRDGHRPMHLLQRHADMSRQSWEPTLRATKLPAKMSCSETGSTSGPRRVMLLLSAIAGHLHELLAYFDAHLAPRRPPSGSPRCRHRKQMPRLIAMPNITGLTWYSS